MAMANDLKGLLINLLESISLKINSPSYRISVAETLLKFGLKRPDVFIPTVRTYLSAMPNQLSSDDRIFVFNTISLVLENIKVLNDCALDEIILLVNLATQEIILSKETDDKRAEASSKLLVTISKSEQFVGAIMEQSLLEKFKPGIPPNRHIIMTLSAISEINPSGFLPYLSDVLSRTNDILPVLKGEQIRSAFSNALCSFSEAIYEDYLLRHRTDQPLNTSRDDIYKDYRDQFEPVYEHALQKWLQKDTRTRANALKCIGYLSKIVSKDKLVRDLKKIAGDSFVVDYKKAKNSEEQLAISIGITKFLEVCCFDDIIQIDAYLADILDNLFPNVSNLSEQSFITDESDQVSPSSIQMKLRSEAFTCFCIAASRFADKEVYYLLQKIQSPKEPMRLGAIEILRHLINNTTKEMSVAQNIITMGLKDILLSDQLTIRVKMGLCQLCISLADNNFVQGEGGQNVLKFLLKNLKPEGPIGKLQNHCAQALYMISNTPSSDELLWPSLFEYVCLNEYTIVLYELIKPLHLLCSRAYSSGIELNFTEFETNQKLAGPFAVMSRLFVAINGISNSSVSNKNEAVDLFRKLAPWFHAKLANSPNKVIEDQISKLKKALETPLHSPSDRNLQTFGSVESGIIEWQKCVLHFQASLIDFIADQEWLEKLAAVQAKHLDLYGEHPHEKAFLMCTLGVSLASITSRQFVINHLSLLKTNTNHSNYTEKTGCAMAIGHAASKTHADLVLTELENFTKEMKRVSSGMVSRIWARADEDKTQLKATIILAFGYVVFYSPSEVFEILDKTVLPFLRQYIENSKEIVVREAHLEVINLISQHVRLRESSHRDYQFQARVESFSYIKQYIQNEIPVESLNSMIRPFAARSLTSLVGLKPPPSDNELEELISLFSQHLFPICREQSSLRSLPKIYELVAFSYPSCELASYKKLCYDHLTSGELRVRISGEATDRDTSTSTIMEFTLMQFQNAITQIVAQRPSVDPTIAIILKVFKEYYGSQHDHERSRAIESTVLALNVYLRLANDITLGHASDFKPLSSIIGRLSPRLCDSLHSVRFFSLQAVWLAFKLQGVHSGCSPETDSDILDSTLFDRDEFAKQHLGTEGRLDSNKCSTTIAAIAKIIEDRLPRKISQIQYYLSVLIKMISDRQGSVASAAAQLISHMLRERGALLNTENAEILFVTIIKQLTEVRLNTNKDQTYKELLNAYALLSVHYIKLSIRILLMQKLPYSTTIVDIWSTLAGDRTHFHYIIDYVLELTNTDMQFADRLSTATPTPADSLPIQQSELTNSDSHSYNRGSTQSLSGPIRYFEITEMFDGRITKIVTSEVCSLLAAFMELIKSGQPESELFQRVPELMATLLKFLVAIIDVNYPKEVHGLASTASPAKKVGAPSPPLTSKTDGSVITAELCRLFDRPSKLVIGVIQELLRRISADAVIERMNTERAWTYGLISQDLYLAAITSFCRTLCEFRPKFLGDLMKTMAAWLNLSKTNTEFDRIAAVAVLDSLIAKCPDDNGRFDQELFNEVFDTLEQVALCDPHFLVRMIALRGLGQIGSMSQPSGSDCFADEYAPRVVRAALYCMEPSNNSDGALITESLVTLNSVVSIVDPILINQEFSFILPQLQTFFDTSDSSLRIIAFDFLNSLGQKTGGWKEYNKLIDDEIITILLHLYDTETAIRERCASLLMLKMELPEPFNKLKSTETQESVRYSEFVQSFCEALIEHFPENAIAYVMKCREHFKSTLPKTRQCATIVIARLLSALTPELRNNVPKDLIFSSLQTLIKDQDEEVRIACVASIALLYMY